MRLTHLHLIGITLLAWLATPVEAQQTIDQDTSTVSAKRSPKNEKKERSPWWLKKPLPDPTKAFYYSAIFPGLGQIYNHKYWKAPIVWGGIAGGAYLISLQQDRYYGFKKELYGLLRDKTYQPPSGLTESQLRSRIDQAQRNRDLFTAITILWYALQAIEAHVDAHLSFFRKNPTLQVSVEPVSNPSSLYGQGYTGLALTLRF